MATVKGKNPAVMTDVEFESFCMLKTKEGGIPAGMISLVDGSIIFVSGAGKRLTQNEYKATYGFDPLQVWQRIQKLHEKTGMFTSPVVIGVVKPQMAPVKLGKMGRVPK